MFNPDELILLAAYGDPNGEVQSRRLETDQTGWDQILTRLVHNGLLVPIVIDQPEPGPGDYLISTHRLTNAGRLAAASLSKQSSSVETIEPNPSTRG